MPGVKDLPGATVHRVTIPAMANAATDDEFAVFVAPGNMKITGFNVVPAVAVVAAATNFTTLSVRNRGAAAAGTALPYSRSYVATNAAANVNDGANAVVSATAADVLVAAGDVITVQRVHSGTGIALPAMTVEVLAQYR
jgi:hypothetical protein